MGKRPKLNDSPNLLENHQVEQYFFTHSTVENIASFLMGFENPCCLCAPTVGKLLAERGRKVTVLDCDERFSHVNGFRKYDLYRPEWIDEKFDIIFCDPPFFKVSLSQLFKALRQLSHNDFTQPIMLCHLTRRSDAVIGGLYLFGLQPTGKVPQYMTVQSIDKNRIQIFSNTDMQGLKL